MLTGFATLRVAVSPICYRAASTRSSPVPICISEAEVISRMCAIFSGARNQQPSSTAHLRARSDWHSVREELFDAMSYGSRTLADIGSAYGFRG